MTAIVLVTAVGEATGAKGAAAALACAGSEPDRPGLLIDVGGRMPRPALVASTGARELEERLISHLPSACVASRGQTCHLALPADPAAFEVIRAALPLVRDSAVVMHLPPNLARIVVEVAGLRPSGVLLRADLARDRQLTALAAGDLIASGFVVRVLKRPLHWVAERRALFGLLSPGTAAGLPAALLAGLLDVSSKSPAGTCLAPQQDG